MAKNFKYLLRRETEVAFSKKVQSVPVRVLKYGLLAVLIYLFHRSKTFWIVFGAVSVLALLVHFWARHKTAGWTKSYGLWKYEQA